MNKIYKVIWSKVKHQYVVTSEFAHSCTKSTTSRVGKSALAALAAFVLTAGVGGVQAAEVKVTVNDEPTTVTIDDKKGLQDLLSEAGIPVGTVNGEHSIAIGEKSRVIDGSQYAMAIGYDAKAAKDNTLAFGTSADAGSKGAIAIGTKAKAKKGLDAMALGNYAAATGTESIAVGKEAKAGGKNAVTVGSGSSAAADNSVAIGNNAGVDEWSQGAIAIGKDSFVHGVYSVAIGEGSSISKENAVALGRNSHANGAGSVALGYHTDAQAEGSVALGDFSIATKANTVSVGNTVGNNTLKRQIVNVAAGTDDDDVVTVGQLKDASDEATKTIHGVILDKGNVTASTVNATDVNVVGGDLYVQTNKADGSTGAEFHVRQDDGLTYMRNLEDGGLSTFNVGDKGAAFVKANVSGEKSMTVIDGGAITTDSIDTKKLTLNGVDFGATLGTIGDNTQHISHYKDEYGVDYTKVEGTVFNADGSMNTANGEFAVYADGSVHSSQNFETKSDVVIVNDDYTPLYSLRNIGTNTQKISYDENSDMTFVNSSFTTKSGNANFKVANGMAAINVGGNTLGMTSEGTTFTNGSSSTVINGGTITTNKLVVNGVDIGNVAGTATETAKKVQNIEHGRDGNGTSYTKVEGVTMKEDGSISAGANGEFSVGSDGTMNTTGSIISVNENGSTEINGGTITTDNINVNTINGKEIGDFATASDVSGIKQDVSGIKGQIGDVSALKGTNASGDKYTNLTDAVNGNYDRIEQNTAAIAQNSQAINSLGHQVSDLGDEIDSVGAISAALAGLHPLDYDGTGSKFQISAAMGTYDGTQAAAIGGFYHFNRDVMMSLGGATSFEGDKKTAANIGVTFRVGEGASGKSVSDDVMARLEAMDQKIAALEQENKDLKNVLGAIDTSLSKEFPDVPANHWAYEAVTKLAGNDVVAGYPDGEFHGDRTMTRYEMAEIIYKAMNRGVQVDQKLVEEFKPEMEQVAANETTQAAPAESTQTGEENA